jgi:hypothetical protein
MLVLLRKRIYEVHFCDSFSWHDIHTKFHDDRFRHPSNIKIITLRVGRTATLLLLREGFMKYTAEIVSDEIMHIPSFIKIGSGFQ